MLTKRGSKKNKVLKISTVCTFFILMIIGIISFSNYKKENDRFIEINQEYELIPSQRYTKLAALRDECTNKKVINSINNTLKELNDSVNKEYAEIKNILESKDVNIDKLEDKVKYFSENYGFYENINKINQLKSLIKEYIDNKEKLNLLEGKDVGSYIETVNLLLNNVNETILKMEEMRSLMEESIKGNSEINYPKILINENKVLFKQTVDDFKDLASGDTQDIIFKPEEYDVIGNNIVDGWNLAVFWLNLGYAEEQEITKFNKNLNNFKSGRDNALNLIEKRVKELNALKDGYNSLESNTASLFTNINNFQL